MTQAEIAALGLTPEELERLLLGFTDEAVVVGTRAEPRTATETMAPVDVLAAGELASRSATSLKDRLRALLPSFNVNSQPIAGVSTIVRPAMLRNLAPDHTLVLVNGKRRHRSSVIDWHGGNGVAFGSQGPDLSTIPAIAVRQIEVLRDGAAAQYGSDAIAGVMNFQLKDAPSGGSFLVNTGVFGEGDGEAVLVAANVGLPLGSSGFANLSLEAGGSNPTNRSAPRRDAAALIRAGNTRVASDTPQIWGEPDIDGDVKVFGNFGYTAATGVQTYSHAGYARKRVTGGFFFRNPNTRGGVFSVDGGRTLLIGDVLRAQGLGDANCPTVAVQGDVPDPDALARVLADPNCFSFQELFPGGFTPRFGGDARDFSLVGGVQGFSSSFHWDLSGSFGAHGTDIFMSETLNASLGPDSPTEFDIGGIRQREIGVNADAAYHAGERVHLAAGAEFRQERYRILQGDRASWEVGPYVAQGFSAGSNGNFGYGPLSAGQWSRRSGSVYGDVEVSGAESDWTIGSAVRIGRFEDFGRAVNGKLSGRFRFLRGGVSTGFRAPTPGQQNTSIINTWFDPTVGDLINLGTIPSTSPLAERRGGAPLRPEKSLNATAGFVFDRGQFRLTADYFRIRLSDRVGITANFTLTDPEIAVLLAEGVDAAASLQRFRFFTNAFATLSQGVDLVSTYTPVALRGNTVFSAVFNYTETEVTDNGKGLLDARRLAEFAYALPRVRWNVAVTQHAGPVEILARVSYFGGWYDYDSGYAEGYRPSDGLAQGFFDGKPILDLEAGVALGRGATLSLGARNVFNTYSQESARARDVGERFSEYTPWGFSGGWYSVQLGYEWGPG